jgi:glycosyltransferase involved in cell wall biosynthesis
MKFAIITHALHYQKKGQVFAYAPYVSEMNIWGRHVDEFIIVAPPAKQIDPVINIPYQLDTIRWSRIPAFSLISIISVLRTIVVLPVVAIKIIRAFAAADHIHLRCPGNIGLLGCLVQIFFPGKPKTAKYAGNWGTNKKQPWSYRFQKWLLGNTFLTRNMQVLVYGEWPNQSKNIRPFFTATYWDREKEPIIDRDYSGALRFVFIGTLSPGKQPSWAARFLETLVANGKNARIDFFGNGPEREDLENYISENGLNESHILNGNQPKEAVKKALKHAHFLILPSLSEGWPKVVAEAMFWGCIPIVSPVSCVPWMLDDGKRGFLVSGNPEEEAKTFYEKLKSKDLSEISQRGIEWSRYYTLDKFEEEIKKLL